jgi:hypothetical protein
MTYQSMEERRAVRDALVGDGDTLSPDDLRRIANAPTIMDPNRIYLPAGKLSEADYRAREARILRGEQA